MIRKATDEDLDQIVMGYNEHFQYEKENGTFTVFKEGIYPTKRDAVYALGNNALYVDDIDGIIAGSIIFDKKQPREYGRVKGFSNASDDKVMVIHLLMVRPSMSGKGIATELINYVFMMAENENCSVLRLDTGVQNTPAISLYKKIGFKIIAKGRMNVGGLIAHDEHLFMEKII